MSCYLHSSLPLPALVIPHPSRPADRDRLQVIRPDQRGSKRLSVLCSRIESSQGPIGVARVEQVARSAVFEVGGPTFVSYRNYHDRLVRVAHRASPMPYGVGDFTGGVVGENVGH